MNVLNAILTHQKVGQVMNMIRYWSNKVAADSIWIAYGGERSDFESIEWAQKVFIDDPRLRTLDHPRERQSYQGVFRALLEAVAEIDYNYLFFTEFDQIPLASDLDKTLIDRLEAERADVLFHGLRRVDGTSHPHYLSHAGDHAFEEFFTDFSVRDQFAVMSAYGFGQFWRRSALEAVLRHPDGMEGGVNIYLELWAPTVAHHLGFRVRGLPDQEPFNHHLHPPAPSPEGVKPLGAWLAHPYKNYWK